MEQEKIDQYKNEQIDIWKMEQNLADKTHKMLFNLLSGMTRKELQELNEAAVSLDEYTTVEEISADNYIDNFGNSNSLEHLNQSQQKTIIDTILLEIFKV